MGRYTLVAFCLWLLSVLPYIHGQLNTADKQSLLDLHNELRGTAGGANILQSAWDAELAQTAQDYAESCHFGPNPSVTTSQGIRRGENLGYMQGSATPVEKSLEIMRQWVEDEALDPKYHIQAVWWNVRAIGCGSFECPRLSLSGGGRVDGASFLVCYYLTVYISNMPPFTPGESCTSCPSGYTACDGNGLCATSSASPIVEDDSVSPPTIVRRVTGRLPGVGSVGGGTRLSLLGQGFSGNQHTGANEVYFISGDTILPCDVQPYYSTTTQIVCDTRPSPNGQEWRSWSLIVRVRDGEDADWEEVDTSCGNCNFQHRDYLTPLIERLTPYAGEPSSLINIHGRIFTVAFDDTPDDPPIDVISRLTVGNRLCNHVDDNGDLYGATMTSSNRGNIYCLTNTTNIIDSMNVTLTLETFGSSIIRQSDYITGFDNKLRPYSYQTHADILSVLPESGSIEGGTTITTETSVNLNGYTSDEVQVYVGGRECLNVVLTGNGSIECTTPSQPPSLPYYPGGRGLLREVWRGRSNYWVIDQFLDEPLSPENSIHEIAYRDSGDPREFGERTLFIQRYKGFFVPPITSLYTFGIISTDLSRLYVSSTSNPDDMRVVAYADQWTQNRWNQYETQTSEPMMLERGQYYYMEAYSNQGGGPWNFGISAKIHSIPYTTYPYIGDRETQRIMTTSNILQETHTLSLTVSPTVYDIDIIYFEEDEGCVITVAIGDDDTLTINRDTTASDLQDMLDVMVTIQEVGGVSIEMSEGEIEGGNFSVSFRLIFLTIFRDNIPDIDVYSNNDTCSSVSGGFVQSSTTPTFQIGFPDFPNRMTNPLSVINTTADYLQTELELLLSYDCIKNIPPTILLDLTYEDASEGDGVVRDRAYCGWQSYQSPITILDSELYPTNIYTHVCFAYVGSLQALRANVHYYTGNDRIGTDITFDLRSCPEWPNSFDGSTWNHICINLHTCLSNYDPEGQMFQVQKLYFDSGTFWIDEFAVSSGTVEVMQIAVPISPGGVQLTAVEVTGGYTLPPSLLMIEESSGLGLDDDFNFGPIPRLIVSSFQVSYTVENCGSGMTLIQGVQSDSSYVIVNQTQSGAPGITGTFDLSFNGREIRGIPSDITATTLDQLLEANFPGEGGFSVMSEGGCAGRWWDVTWNTREADIPTMTANGDNLIGSDPMVVVVTRVDGGMWLRPLRGDMLRVPKSSPQVEVIINDIPSSCKSENCAFNYSSEATPVIESVYPSSGQQGINITIYGSGFQGDSYDYVRVWLGEVECYVRNVNESEITCTVQSHPAGSVRIAVYIPGRGFAGTANDTIVCFNYLVRLNGIYPAMGSTEGGTVVTLSGEGFLPTVSVESSNIGSPLDSTAWLANGIGWPVLPSLSTLCPDLVDEISNTSQQTLQYQLLTMYSNDRTLSDLDKLDRLQLMIANFYRVFPISVFIGSSPCIVVTATQDQLTCTTTQHEANTVNVTVSILGETAILEDGYTYNDTLTPIINAVSPISGPVYGNTLVTVEGENLEDTTGVMIGDASCVIMSQTNTYVLCITTSHAPSTLPVVVSTTQGLARVASEGSGYYDLSLEFLLFYTYVLEVNSIGPLIGSVQGGLLLTIEGWGFHPTLTSVLIGGRPATITLADDSIVQCIVPPPTIIHTITFIDDGFSVEDGYQFSWSIPNAVVQRGDTVNWEWNLDFPGFTVNVFQTPDAGLSSPLEGGFSTDSSSSSGSFSYIFKEPGIYYYATELTQQLVVYGVITVQDIESQTAGIIVAVDGYEADYIPFTPTSGDMSGSGDVSGSGDMSVIGDIFGSGVSDSGDMYDSEDTGMIHEQLQRRLVIGCEDDLTNAEEDGFSLVYSVCNTPTVTSVTPQSGTILTNFTLIGTLFTPLVAGETVAVEFGGYDCMILSSTDTEITCWLDPATMPPSFSDLTLSLNVPGLGAAIINTLQTTIQLTPVITSLSPSSSSIEGGGHLFILGYGFPDDELSVNVGSDSCTIQSQNYGVIQCVLAGGSSGSASVQVALSSSPQEPFECMIESGCTVNYSNQYTPLVDMVTPMMLVGPDTITMEISGNLFSDVASDNKVIVGLYYCEVTWANSTSLQCNLPAIPSGEYQLSLIVCPSYPNITSYCPGSATIMVPPLTSPDNITNITPQQGSVAGGTQLVITGLGFSSDLSVIIGELSCTITNSNYSSIECVTMATAEGTYDVIVTSLGTIYPTTLNYTFSMDITPMVMSVTPSNGQQGTDVTIEGMNLGGDEATSVDIGGSECTIDIEESNDTSIVCMLGLNLAGEHNINVEVGGLGMAMVQDELTFNYDLELTSFSPTIGSLAGMSSIVVSGLGFNPTEISINVCGQPCILSTTPGSLSDVECLLPPMTTSGDDTVIDCGVSVQSLGEATEYVDMFTYSVNLTPIVTSINRTRGGTQGGSRILIEGSGFDGGNVSVTIAEVVCEVLSVTATEIVCDTGASGRTIRAQVMVFVDGKGFAQSEDIIFWYVDLWSSRFTWGNEDPPSEGQFVVVPRGQTLVLDTVTPVLSYLLVQGGELIFDNEAMDNQVELHTHGMLITDGGRLEVGTEDQPFEAKTQIVLYGDVLSTEIPVYGAKTLALRQGSIDIHGKPLQKTWTRLAETATVEDTVLYLQEVVDWSVGGRIVIASTSFSQRENEEHIIAEIMNGGTSIRLESPLEYDHISVTQTIDGREIDTSAEVGYLTRNVVVRGSINEEFLSNVSACPEEFRTGQFQLQTCFLGRFGAETISDQFGSQIMIHAPEQNMGDVIGRFSYIEVTHAGQAFRLGRYPIHFHLNGDVSGSYVRGCSIHHTFNRAVTIHAVDNLLVENNVAYNILGHAYFLEDGIEQNNIIQDNLGIFVRASSSLLNVDITPAVFWMVNPNNIVRRNAAAGGTHFGFWYRLPVNPTGPSFDQSVFPRRLPLGEFSDNSAHSFGWYGLWVFPEYSPDEPAVFTNFLSWKNERGVEFADSGALQLHNSTLLDNELAGFESTAIESEWGGPLVKNVLIVGHSEVTIDDTSFCTTAGIKTPHTPYLTVESVTFVNFDREGCTSIAACSHCKNLQGGFETRYSDIQYINSPRLTTWQWMHEHYHRDLDGTLTGTGEPSLLVASSDLLPPSCIAHDESSYSHPGSICPGSLDFTRFALYNPTPSGSLRFALMYLTNIYGTTEVEYEDKRLLIGNGHMALLPVNETYTLEWDVGVIFTNTTYNLLITQLDEDDYIFIAQPYPEQLDSISINGKIVNVSESFLSDPTQAETGDWFTDDNNTINYIVVGDDDGRVDVRLETYTCFYDDCIPPPPPTLPPPIPPGRPDVTQSWSNQTIWPDGELPQEGDNVFINCSWYLLLDVAIPRLGTVTVCGVLEVLDGMDHVIEADVIIITGRLVAGYPDTPFTSKVSFLLHGNTSSPEVTFDRGPILGAKAIGAFGELILTSIPRTPSWTTLGATVEVGGTEIVLSESVEWEIGDEIVITTTSFEGRESETAIISAVSDSKTTLTLSSPLLYRHVYETENLPSGSYSLTAEVGLLTRDITITNGDTSLSDMETFGCRVLVGNIEENGGAFVGSVQMEGVELKGCGQFGYTDDFDPRFAIAILNAGDSYIRSSSVHDGYNVGIGVFGTNGVQVTDNVVHNTVGSSILANGFNLVVTGNLASLSNFLATYRNDPDNQPANSDWTANFELASTTNITLRGNVAAGGNKAGFHVNGDDCNVEGAALQVADNIAHSTLHGIHLGYGDGHPSGCTHIARFTAHSCYHYGIFSFNPAEVRVSGSTLFNNNAGIFIAVIGPPSLTHQLGNKQVIIEDTLIISATPDLDCTGDSIIPRTSLHPLAYSNLRLSSPTGGHVGIIIPVFTSSQGHRLLSGWSSISAYPAISGKTTIRDVTFANFGSRCPNIADTLLMTHARSEDCNHPTHLQEIVHYNNNDDVAMKYFNHDTILGSINPSDCVDLDCDGLKHVLVRDDDGTFLQEGGPRSLVSMAEIGWGDNGPRGLGNFRIPTTMLATPGGGMLDADVVFPSQGIVRGTGNHGDDSQCVWVEEWNSYSCQGIDHVMIVIESLDDDTEVRRLSPVGLAANGFIDILNGPMDNGWCGGYTCQERISTFFGVIATGLYYTMALTSTNPQNMALHLLNANNDQAIVIAIIYTSPQRLDVYHDGVYIVPNNAIMLENGNLEYQTGTAEDFIPTMTQHHGANYYDRDSKQLHILMRGDRPYVIRTTAVIQVGLSLEVTVDDFFNEDQLVQNLAFLLGIDQSQIRVVSVVMETITKRRRRQDESGMMRLDVEFEIGNPPVTTVTINTNTPDNETMNNNDTQTPSTLSFDELNELTEILVDVIQTGELTSDLNATVVNAVVMEPEPEPEDPTNGTRATPESGGPQPGQNGTETLDTFYDMQVKLEEEEMNDTQPIFFTIPTRLSIKQDISEVGEEGRPLTQQPIIVMYDNLGNIIDNLGLDEAWRVSVIINQGPPEAFLINTTADLINGHAKFTGIQFSYPGNYLISFTVEFPETVNFSIMSEQEVIILPRNLTLVIVTQPSQGNTTSPLYPYTAVQLWEDSQLLDDHDWRNSTWFITATLLRYGEYYSSWEVELNSGYAEFTEIDITEPGQYSLVFSVFTKPSSVHIPVSVTSETFSVIQNPFTRLELTFDEEYEEIIGENNEYLTEFETEFINSFWDAFPSDSIEIYNLTINRGSIIVSIFLTAVSASDLLAYVENVVSSNGTLVFTFRNVVLSPSIFFTIPTRLSIEKDISEVGEEGRPLTQQPIIVMYDNLGDIIDNLGLDEAWRVSVIINQGPSEAFLINNTANLINGRAEFTGIQFSYPGNYLISFTVEFPETVNFSIISEQEVIILPRNLTLVIVTEPSQGNTTSPLYPYPAVQLWEDGQLLDDHDWRNSTWFITATLLRYGEYYSSWEVELNSGYAEFTEIDITEPGQYSLVFSVFTKPSSVHIPVSVTSETFSVIQNPFTRLELTFDEEYEEIIGENNEYLTEFETEFINSFWDAFPSDSIEIYNLTINRGSIIVSIFLTAVSASDLLAYVENVVSSNGTLVFTFRNVVLSPSIIVQDPAYPINIPGDSEDELTLILVSIIPSGTILIITLVIILTATICYRHRKKTQSFKPRSVANVSNVASFEREGRYVQHNMGLIEQGDVEEFYLIKETEKRLDASNSTLTFQSFEMKEKKNKPESPVSLHDPIIVSKEVKVPGGSVFVNPSLELEEVGKYVAVPTKPAATNEGIGGLQKEMDEILTMSTFIEAESHLQ